MPKNEVAIKEPENELFIPFDNVPDYLKGNESSGLDAFGKNDFTIPRLKLLQALNPEVRDFPGKAIPGEFWHTGSNLSLGASFEMVICTANKRVMLYQPRDTASEQPLLAMSRNGRDWQTGGNKTFKVKLKGRKDEVVWHTKSNVQDSGLLNWGTSDPDDERSGPAATMVYEYLCYLPKFPHMSPVVYGVYSTAIAVAKNLNTQIATSRRPVTSIVVRVSSNTRTKGKDVWFVPKFELVGSATKPVYEQSSAIAEKYGTYDVDYSRDEVATVKEPTEY